MPKFTDTVEVYDTHHKTTRAIKVEIFAPEGGSVLNVQELAEKAWASRDKKITVDGVTVKVRAFTR